MSGWGKGFPRGAESDIEGTGCSARCYHEEDYPTSGNLCYNRGAFCFGRLAPAANRAVGAGDDQSRVRDDGSFAARTDASRRQRWADFSAPAHRSPGQGDGQGRANFPASAH